MRVQSTYMLPDNLVTDDEMPFMLEDLKMFKATKDFRFASLGEEGVKLICKRLWLDPFLEFFMDFNPSNDAPYHNKYHTFCMVNNCYEGSYHLRLSPSEVKALVVAALFHDFDHSAGNQSDGVNITKALAGLKVAQRFAESRGLGLNQAEYKLVTEAIKVTQYPFTVEPTTITEKIIRDADLMQPYETDKEVLFKQYKGLKQEIELSRNMTISNAEFGIKNKEFLDGITWYTPWAREKALKLDWEKAKATLKELFLDA